MSGRISPRQEFPPVLQVDITDITCSASVTSDLLDYIADLVYENKPLQDLILYGVHLWKGVDPKALTKLASKCSQQLHVLGVSAKNEFAPTEQVQASLTNFITEIAHKTPLHSISLYGFTKQYLH